jgi:hypothetical protein
MGCCFNLWQHFYVLAALSLDAVFFCRQLRRLPV